MQPLSVQALILQSRRLREQSSQLRQQIEASPKRSNGLRRASAGEDRQPSAANLSLMRGSALRERVVFVHLPKVEAQIAITYPACLDSQKAASSASAEKTFTSLRHVSQSRSSE